MKKNLDNYLTEFLSTGHYIFLDTKYGESISYKFSMSGTDIYVTTSNPEIVCRLGEFERLNEITYHLQYYYQVNCMLESKTVKDTVINVINKMYTSSDTRSKLVEYLKLIHQ